MKEKWYLLVVCLIMSVLIFPEWGLSAPKKPMTVEELALYRGTDRQQILEEGAKKEGNLTFYTMGIMHNVRPVVAAFEKKYPFIKVNIWRASHRTLIPRILEEFRAGKSADVIRGHQMTDLTFFNAGLLQPFYSPNMTSMEKGVINQAPGGLAYSVGFRRTGLSLGYNTKLLSKDQIPKTYQDLLDPKWKGKMTMGASSGVNWIGTILDNLGEGFVERLSQQNIVIHTISGRAILDLIVSGEYPLSPAIWDAHVFVTKKAGAAIDWHPIEPVMVNIGRICLPKLSPHPHAAMLLIDFYLTKPTAESLVSQGIDSPRLDMPGAVSYKGYIGPKTMKDLKKWTDVFNRMILKR
jgi:iron(III) transport system substrate-binding protein